MKKLAYLFVLIAFATLSANVFGQYTTYPFEVLFGASVGFNKINF